ncbi:hypothetical protein KDH_29430 [Dictyobacter sp. S3.2.2.5]|uniref:Uncharacterized protein n=1 Tax=Dictyobacter halimunensis TaxID=3026934 RepID=A0ABQ6FPF6_9CHLR|nr:hypothetical protein KDH_29430 [Dictyobacter sp. S3.2.2.5]
MFVRMFGYKQLIFHGCISPVLSLYVKATYEASHSLTSVAVYKYSAKNALLPANNIPHSGYNKISLYRDNLPTHIFLKGASRWEIEATE